jgi:monoamine oxidase
MNTEERRQAAHTLARMLLMLGEDGRDLTLEYLKILIDDGLPASAGKPGKVLVLGAGIAGLVATALLTAAGHQVQLIEANGNRVGGRIKTLRKRFAGGHYAEAGAMRIPDFHPMTLALIDKLRLQRRLFYNVDVDPRSGNEAKTPPVVYHQAWDGLPVWSNGPCVPEFKAPDKQLRTWIATNGMQVRRRQYANDPAPVNQGFEMKRAFGTTTGVMLDAALDVVRDHYSEIVPGSNPPVRRNFPFQQWIEGWEEAILDFDQYSMRRFLREQAHLTEEAIQAIGTLENLTARLPLSFIHSYIARSMQNPGVQYWEIAGGMSLLTDKLAEPFFGDGEEPVIYMNRRVTDIEYYDPERPCDGCTHVGENGPHVWVRTIPEPCSEPQEPMEFTGDLAIVTIPFSALRFTRIRPLMSYRKRRAVIELHYDAATKVLLQFSKRWWEFTEDDWKNALTPDEFVRFRRDVAAGRQPIHHFFGGGSVTDGPARACYYPSRPTSDSDGGVILASYTWADDARRWDSIPDENRARYALKNLIEIHGPWIEKFYMKGHDDTQSWSRDYYAFGEASVFAPGQFTLLHPAVPLPEGPLHFAGEHTSLKHAWIEGAVESAVRAALEVHTGE